MSARAVQGKIEFISSKTWEDSGNTTHSFKLEGSNEWFRCGSNPIPAGKGQNVKFTMNGTYVDLANFQVVDAVSVSQAPTVTAPSAPAPEAPQQFQRRNQGGGGFRAKQAEKDQYWNEKERREIEKDARYQAVAEPRMALSVATEAASRLVSAAIAKDALSFGNAAKAKKLGLLSSYVKEVALELALFIQDAPDQIASYKTSLKAEATAPKADESEEE